jgi:hypothetical protein
LEIAQRLRRREFLQLSALGGAWALTRSSFGLSPTAESMQNQHNSPPRDNDPRRLFLDSRLIAKAEGVRLVLGTVTKDPHNPLFGQDKPWEVRFDNLYPNILYDADERIYKCWYTPYLIDPGTTNTPRELRPYRNYVESNIELGVCYATSRDGILWEKPELGLVEFQGSTKNNIVLRRDESGDPGEAGVIKDLQEVDSLRRYKMFLYRYGESVEKSPGTMALAFSEDGLRWSKPQLCPEIQAHGDTHNNLLWSPEPSTGLGRWVGFTRLWDASAGRLVGRTESPDLASWTRAVEVLRALPSERWRQTYGMLVFRHANLYLGLVMMMNEDGDHDTVDCELAWSPDTIRWERVCPGTPFIPRGALGSYDSLCIYPGAYPIQRQGDIRLYYGGSNGKHSGFRDGFFCLAHLRPDGYAGLTSEAAGQVGISETHPIECVGTQLHLTTDAAGGRVRVAIVDADGYDMENCEPIVTNCTDEIVRWKGKQDISDFLGKYCRLRFEATAAKLYSLTFS